ncbi:mannose-1-phosphate guanylyltransferase [Longispora sp. K20-0274]|uniref:mannose-1-phosphate guanylyltransferase n=1 Tax=Longispora sp. K20-0274 TaxID=3088255 RepID=UPI00399B3CF3
MLYSVIPAGGSGTRLWPLSRAGHPKFLHPLTGSDRSLLQATVDRLGPLSPADRTYVVTGVSHAVNVSRQLPDVPEANILVEPSPRDSCAAIGLAAAVIAQRDPGAIMGVFSADHLIGDEARFVEVIREAMAAASAGYLATLGITPTRPEVGFGYLKIGAPVHGAARQVEEFREKPAHELAVQYTESGEYLWNAGMFVFQVETFLGELARQKPDLHAGITTIAAAWDTPDRDTVMADVWPGLEKISIDYAVMEGAAAAGRVVTVPGDFPWSDVGDFHALGESLPCDDAGNLILGGERANVLTRDVKDSVIVAGTGRVVAAIGVDNLVIVDTPDALMVVPRGRAQEVKQIVDELKARGEDRYV